MARSRYFQTPIIAGELDVPDEYASYDIPDTQRGYDALNLLEGVQTFEHVIKLGDRLDHLASKYYGDDQYWWVIARVNDIMYPLAIAPGTLLLVPTDVRPVLEKLNLV